MDSFVLSHNIYYPAYILTPTEGLLLLPPKILARISIVSTHRIPSAATPALAINHFINNCAHLFLLMAQKNTK